MDFKKYALHFSLLGLTVVFLLVHSFYFHWDFLLHLAAISLEVLVGVLIVGQILRRQKDEERERRILKTRELLVRTDLADVIFHSIRILKKPCLGLEDLENASQEKIREHLLEISQGKLECIQVQSGEKAMEHFVDSFIEAESALQRELTNAENFKSKSFDQLVGLLHTIHTVKLARQRYTKAKFKEYYGSNTAHFDALRHGIQTVLEIFLEYLAETKRFSPNRTRILRELKEIEELEKEEEK